MCDVFRCHSGNGFRVLCCIEPERARVNKMKIDSYIVSSCWIVIPFKWPDVRMIQLNSSTTHFLPFLGQYGNEYSTGSIE